MIRLILTLLALLVASPAFAQAGRTFVSGSATDNPNCSRPSPCRTMQAALNVTIPYGEVVVLDDAGYGPIVITQPVTILAEGKIWAISAAPGGVAIAVNASGPVRLEHVRITCLNQPGTTGILVQNGMVSAQARIMDCPISAQGLGLDLR